jgi:hypothetical protein
MSDGYPHIGGMSWKLHRGFIKKLPCKASEARSERAARRPALPRRSPLAAAGGRPAEIHIQIQIQRIEIRGLVVELELADCELPLPPLLPGPLATSY